jgi:hypothetical protein
MMALVSPLSPGSISIGAISISHPLDAFRVRKIKAFFIIYFIFMWFILF